MLLLAGWSLLAAWWPS